MNSAARFKESAVIKAQRDRQDRSNPCTLERLSEHGAVICCPRIGGFSSRVFIYLLVSLFIFLLESLPRTGGDSSGEGGFPVSAENMQM